LNDVPVHRLSAFSCDPSGGNPAGVWIGESFPSERVMLEIAADVGYSETVFAVGQGPTLDVRYFSPEDEGSFCGHAPATDRLAPPLHLATP
jgi:PhzF family phenazine biosynthesis protein